MEKSYDVLNESSEIVLASPEQVWEPLKESLTSLKSLTVSSTIKEDSSEVLIKF